MAGIENPVPRAAAEAIAALIAARPECASEIIADPVGALGELGISDDLARSLAGIVASEYGHDVGGYSHVRPVDSLRQCANCTVACVVTRVVVS
jgi:hypothetical protein